MKDNITKATGKFEELTESQLDEEYSKLLKEKERRRILAEIKNEERLSILADNVVKYAGQLLELVPTHSGKNYSDDKPICNVSCPRCILLIANKDNYLYSQIELKLEFVEN